MPAKSAPKSAPKTARPARKGNVRTSNGSAAPVRSRKLSASERKTGTAKLGKPTARRAAPKPTAKPVAKTASADRTKTIAKVAKLRAKGVKWDAIAAETGISLSALARIRKEGKANGVSGFGG